MGQAERDLAAQTCCLYRLRSWDKSYARSGRDAATGRLGHGSTGPRLVGHAASLDAWDMLDGPACDGQPSYVYSRKPHQPASAVGKGSVCMTCRLLTARVKAT